MIRLLRQFYHRRKLAHLVRQARESYECKRYRDRREAALKVRRRRSRVVSA